MGYLELSQGYLLGLLEFTWELVIGCLRAIQGEEVGGGQPGTRLKLISDVALMLRWEDLVQSWAI